MASLSGSSPEDTPERRTRDAKCIKYSWFLLPILLGGLLVLALHPTWVINPVSLVGGDIFIWAGAGGCCGADGSGERAMGTSTRAQAPLERRDAVETVMVASVSRTGTNLWTFWSRLWMVLPSSGIQSADRSVPSGHRHGLSASRIKQSTGRHQSQPFIRYSRAITMAVRYLFGRRWNIFFGR